MPETIFRFAESLRRLLEARTPADVEQLWGDHAVDALGWRAFAHAWHTGESRERALDEVDGLLLRVLDRFPVLADGPEPGAVRVRTFLVPLLERLQHAAAATLVGQRYGVAGLRTVIADADAPLARRYFAFLGLAELHPPSEWPVFARYLTPAAHHAFQGAAAEAARFYPENGAAFKLLELFDAVRTDLHLRAFLSPRILESLYVLTDPATLPFLRDLLTAGFTDPDPDRCEVTRALVLVRRLTGRLEPSIKYLDTGAELVRQAVDAAEAGFERSRTVLNPVTLI